MEWVVDQQRSSRGVGGNQVYLDEKLAARGNRVLRDGGGVAREG